MAFRFNPFTNKLDEVDTNTGAGPVLTLTGTGGGGPISPVAGNINLSGAGGVTVSGAGNTLTISVAASGFTWHTITSGTNPNPIVVENGYITAGVAQVNLVLPAAANVGDTFIITGYSSLFQIQQNAGQKVYFGSQTSSLGGGGSITSTMIKDHIEILCVIANLEFKVTDSIGNFTVV